MNLIFNTEEETFIKENYGKISYLDMSKVLKRDWMDIRHCAKRLGVVQKGKTIKRNFSGKLPTPVNNAFFETLTPLSCYWAGYLAADGTIQNITEKHKRITLKLAIKDEERVLKFKKDTDYKGKVLYYTENQHKQVLVKITSKQMAEDLEKNFKVGPRKTFSLDFPKIDDPFLLDCFIVGYIDGDGCINQKKEKKRFYINVLGTKLFLIKMAYVFYKKSGEYIKVSVKQKGYKIYKIHTTGKTARKLYNHYYYVANKIEALQRKWGETPTNAGFV